MANVLVTTVLLQKIDVATLHMARVPHGPGYCCLLLTQHISLMSELVRVASASLVRRSLQHHNFLPQSYSTYNRRIREIE